MLINTKSVGSKNPITICAAQITHWIASTHRDSSKCAVVYLINREELRVEESTEDLKNST